MGYYSLGHDSSSETIVYAETIAQVLLSLLRLCSGLDTTTESQEGEEYLCNSLGVDYSLTSRAHSSGGIDIGYGFQGRMSALALRL